jgi:hypothetical protein
MRTLIFEAVYRFVKWSHKVRKRGRRPYVIGGAVVGGLIGASFGFIIWPWFFIGFILGGWLGASLSAVAFPMPPDPPAPLVVPMMDGTPFEMGPILDVWTSSFEGIHGILVVLERAVFMAASEESPWQEVRQKLGAGYMPSVVAGELIPIESITSFGIMADLDGALDFRFTQDSAAKSRFFIFGSTIERDRFLALICQKMGASLEPKQQPDGFIDSTWAPLSLLIVLLLLSAGGTYLAYYWIENPPPPLPSTGKRDSLVSSLMWLGPARTCAAFAIPMCLALVWLVYRAIHRTSQTVLTWSQRDGATAPKSNPQMIS